MINRQDIIDRATEWQLRPEVVEKDYILGWLLCGIASHQETRDYWVFKGGTCIKKAYFETYRFSEDLDFSLLPEAPYTEEAIRHDLEAVAQLTAELSGIELPTGQIVVRSQHNRQGQPTFQGRIYYKGPLGFPGYARIIFDITQHELIVDQPVARVIFHPYPDTLPSDLSVLTYSLEELLAEKTRALYERTRPRDLYDVVYLLENRADAVNLSEVRRIFNEKCHLKGLEMPSVDVLREVVQGNEELRSEWENMLAHQLPSLPQLEDLVQRFMSLITWIEEPAFVPVAATLQTVSTPQTETSIPLAGIRYWGSGSPIETIRFAGANRLLLEFSYHGRHRTVEPYSLRRASTGNILLYAWELASGHIKAFKISEMVGVQSISRGFTPRYRVELSEGSISIPPVASLPRSYPTIMRLTSARRSASKTGRTYVFECPYCNKRFRRQKYDSTLRPHKTKDGWNCPGRHAYLVDTEY